ncbi:hypothetical protein B1A_19518, partial [mine drainage metagenome]
MNHKLRARLSQFHTLFQHELVPLTDLYDLMDAYCSPLIRQHSRDLNHIPLIDHNPRDGQKIDEAGDGAKRAEAIAKDLGAGHEVRLSPRLDRLLVEGLYGFDSGGAVRFRKLLFNISHEQYGLEFAPSSQRPERRRLDFVARLQVAATPPVHCAAVRSPLRTRHHQDSLCPVLMGATYAPIIGTVSTYVFSGIVILARTPTPRVKPDAAHLQLQASKRVRRCDSPFPARSPRRVAAVARLVVALLR